MQSVYQAYVSHTDSWHILFSYKKLSLVDLVRTTLCPHSYIKMASRRPLNCASFVHCMIILASPFSVFQLSPTCVPSRHNRRSKPWFIYWAYSWLMQSTLYARSLSLSFLPHEVYFTDLLHYKSVDEGCISLVGYFEVAGGPNVNIPVQGAPLCADLDSYGFGKGRLWLSDAHTGGIVHDWLLSAIGRQKSYQESEMGV